MPTAVSIRRRRMPLPQRREQIVRSAMSLFARHGFAGTTTQEIARRAGISEALLFRIFRDKRSLYSAIIDHRIAETGDDLFPVEASAAGRDEEVFGTVARVILESMERDATFTRLMLYSGLEGHELARMAYDARVSKLYAFLEGHIRRGIRQKRFRSVRPELAARTFVGMVYAFMLNRVVFRQDAGTPLDSRALSRAFVDLMLKGIRK